MNFSYGEETSCFKSHCVEDVHERLPKASQWKRNIFKLNIFAKCCLHAQHYSPVEKKKKKKQINFVQCYCYYFLARNRALITSVTPLMKFWIPVPSKILKQLMKIPSVLENKQANKASRKVHAIFFLPSSWLFVNICKAMAVTFFYWKSHIIFQSTLSHQ